MRANLRPVLFIVGLTVGVFLFSRNPLTAPYSLQATLAVLLGFIFYSYLVKKQGRPLETETFVFLLATFILFLVAATGWFFSPFFFSLYLLALLLAFIFSPAVAAGFVATLVGLFSFNIGELDLAYDFLVVLSLLTVVPLSFYLRNEFLKLKEAKKEILVLEREKRTYQNKIEEVLANVVHQFSISLVQPINDIKQIAYRLEKVKDKEKAKKSRERVITLSEYALRLLKKFEEEATGKKLLTTPENP